jgi:hypothetical protein
MTSDMWCDDDRRIWNKSIRNVYPCDDTTTMTSVMYDIATDYLSSPESLLWDEIEYVNYTYELAYLTETSQSDEETEDFEESNIECIDIMVKNSTAYL